MRERYGFGPFELLHDTRELRRDGRPVRIGSRAFDLLLALIERRDRVVESDELLELVWPGTFVEPNNLQVQIWAIRRCIGEDAILNVPRRGYRFVRAIERVVEMLPAAAGPRVPDAFFAMAASRNGAANPHPLRWRSRAA